MKRIYAWLIIIGGFCAMACMMPRSISIAQASTPNPYTWVGVAEDWDGIANCEDWDYNQLVGDEYLCKTNSTTSYSYHPDPDPDTQYATTDRIIAALQVECYRAGGNGTTYENGGTQYILTQPALSSWATTILDWGNANNNASVNLYQRRVSGDPTMLCRTPQVIWSPYELPNGKADTGVINGDFDVPNVYWTNYAQWYAYLQGPDSSPGYIRYDYDDGNLTSDPVEFQTASATLAISVSHYTYKADGSGDYRVYLKNYATDATLGYCSYAAPAASWTYKDCELEIDSTSVISYYVLFDVYNGDLDLLLDDVQVAYEGSETFENPPPTWEVNAWLYYPYTRADGWGMFQTYSDTTWYGGTYANYNIWSMRPGSHAYPIATLDIVDVGVNSFGYYIDARINAWPDVPSTTVRYEGMRSVTVSPGQRVGPNCDLGEIAPNNYLNGVYHLLLYTEFDGAPINPVPFMGKYPDPTMCVPVDPTSGDTIGPGAGEVPNLLLEVCQSCSVPSTWTNLGRWIVWLECMIQNLFMCHLVTWFNGVINMQVLALQQSYEAASAMMGRFNDLVYVQILGLGRLVDMGDWMVLPVNGGLQWLASAATETITYGADRYGDLAARLENIGYIIMSFSGNSVTTIYNQAGTNFWDFLVSLSSVLSNMLDLLSLLIGGIFDVILLLLRILADMAQFLIMLITGFFSGIGGGGEADVDLIAGVTGISGTLSCTPDGAFAVAGASEEKALCFALTGLYGFNALIGETILSLLPTIFAAVLFIGLAFWVVGQFREIMAT